MKSTFRLGTWAGISVYAHWTFVAMMVGLFVFFFVKGGSVLAAVAGLALVAAAFVCVILHEYGHALMARRFGIPTLDITMYPIGGIARLKEIPRDPRKEFLIAVAGPAVNLAIAFVLFLINNAQSRPMDLASVLGPNPTVLGLLTWINLVMAGFNMLPAFPMDGGRALRALLSARIGHARGTQIAGMVGMGMAGVFVVAGLVTTNVMLIFIAVFVYLGAKYEMQQAVSG